MSAPVPLVTDTLSADQWLRLLKEMERFASNQLRLYRWRGLPGGVPPDGFDPPSLASEVIAQLLSRTHCRDVLLPSLPTVPSSRLTCAVASGAWSITSTAENKTTSSATSRIS